MKVAYLVNRYPGVSHSFIRREIHALERLGIEITRVSIRPSDDALPDARDREEWLKTSVLLASGFIRLLMKCAAEAIRAPLRTGRVALASLKLGSQSDAGIVRHAAYLVEACALKRICDKSGIRHVHAHFATNPPMVALYCKLLGGPTYSFTTHGAEECLGRGNLAEKVAAASHVVTVSHFLRAQLFRHSAILDWPWVHVVHCGLEADYLNHRPTVITPSTRQIVCVGRLSAEKGHVVLVRAAALLAAKTRDFQLVLVGDGPLRNAVEKEIQRLRVGDLVILRGQADGATVQREILASRALVLPSFAEGLPVVLMEALALARPVVTTWVAGIPELVENGVNGWLVPPGSAEALVDALEHVLTTPVEKLSAMGCRGREKVLRNHNAATEAAKLAALFKQAIEANDNR